MQCLSESVQKKREVLNFIYYSMLLVYISALFSHDHVGEAMVVLVTFTFHFSVFLITKQGNSPGVQLLLLLLIIPPVLMVLILIPWIIIQKCQVQPLVYGRNDMPNRGNDFYREEVLAAERN